MKLIASAYRLENKTPFKIAHGERTFTDSLIVSIEHEGIVGYGEASHVPYYNIDITDSIKLIEANCESISSSFGKSHEVFWKNIDTLLGSNHFAKCALDLAYYDWMAKQKEKPLWQYLGLRNTELPKSSFTIGIGNLEKMSEEIEATDFPYLKLKLGKLISISDLRAVKGLTQKPLKVDANASWSFEEAVDNIAELDKLGLELIEQPLSKTDLEKNGSLRKMAKTPIYADESCFSLQDVNACSKNFDGINIKLSKCGGIFPALEMIKRARSLGMGVMIGCMTESSIGISCIAHLSSLSDHVDMDGATLLKNDPAEGVRIEKGASVFNESFGHGAVLKD